MEETLTQQELDERIAILKRFRTLLQKQRDKFREYLTVLEKQQTSITTEDASALMHHTELEQQVVANIVNLRKVINPINDMYNDMHGKPAGSQTDVSEIQQLQQDLNTLQTKVLAQNALNRDLLRTHMSQIRRQLDTLNNPYKTRQSVYAEQTASGSFIELQA